MNRKEVLADIGRFNKEYRYLPRILALCILLTYGGRIIHDNIFVDSELMMLRPYQMQKVWLGSNRFGLVFTSRLFGMGRLIPWFSAALMVLMMWGCGMALAFSAYTWCGKNRRYRLFLYLFPLLYVTAPVFAGQYLFILQAFEISFAILLCILAVFCVGNYIYRIYRGGGLWLGAGLVLMVWAFGSYQAMLPFYISLVLCSFLLVYMNQEAEGSGSAAEIKKEEGRRKNTETKKGKSPRAFIWGLKHLAVFAAGAVLYAVIAAVVKTAIQSESSYVSNLIHWKSDGWRMCLQYIWLELVRVLKAKAVYFHSLYLPSMLLFTVQVMWLGWKRKAGLWDYFWFLFGGGLFLSSPFFLTLVTGYFQQIRSQMVYPLTSACFLAHLTVWPEGKENVLKGYGKRRKIRWKPAVTAVLAAAGVLTVSRNVAATAQLFETAWEAYRNDVLTANRIYSDICEIANRSDMENCKVIFTGRRSAGLSGPVTMGELSGLSFFEAEAWAPMGVSGRVNGLFSLLGLNVVEMNAELYGEAAAFMQDAPDWPAQGSIREMGDFVVVRLSE